MGCGMGLYRPSFIDSPLINGNTDFMMEMRRIPYIDRYIPVCYRLHTYVRYKLHGNIVSE
jgi:hypothetical protein